MQDPIARNGQRSMAFWERIVTHYALHKLVEGGVSSSWTLETKSGVRKCDCAKFVGYYNSIIAPNESRSSLWDTLSKL
jgi:hypothetical protein